MKPFSLLPQPVSVQLAPDRHTLRSRTAIHVPDPAEHGIWIAAQGVQRALADRGVEATIRQGNETPDDHGTIVMTVGDPRGNIEDEPGRTPGAARDEAYRLTIDSERVTIVGMTPVGLAHGARTLTQLLAGETPIPCLTIEDSPAFKWRGVMLDVSRGKVPTLTTLRHIVDVMASFKLNMLQLYMEDTFAFSSHPRIGEDWGALTPEEVRQLDAYCHDRYIDLVPCFQSLGHHRRLLSLPEYAHLSYSSEDWTLTPGEESWKLLEELYDDLLPCFTSRFVNICCDEPYDLTHTSPLTHEVAIGYTGPVESPQYMSPDDPFVIGTHLYLAHVQRLVEMLEARGRTVMLWDDIFQQAPHMLTALPCDVIYLCWFYEAAEDYPGPRTIGRAQRRSIVCPGTSTWNTLWSRHNNARTNIRNFVRSGLDAGSCGVLVTDWGDNGHPNFLGASWYGYAFAAAESWAPGRLSDDEFERRFTAATFGAADGARALEALRALSAACTLPGIDKMNGSATRAMFFRDPLTDTVVSGASDEVVETVHLLALRALEMLAPLRESDANRALTLDEMRVAAQQIDHAARKTRAGRRLAGVLDDADARRDMHVELQSLKRELHALRRDYERLWLARNKPEGIWLTLDQFDAAAAVLDRWRGLVAPRYRHNQ